MASQDQHRGIPGEPPLWRDGRFLIPADATESNRASTESRHCYEIKWAGFVNTGRLGVTKVIDASMVLDGFCCATAAVVSDQSNVLTKIRIRRFIVPPIRQSG